MHYAHTIVIDLVILQIEANPIIFNRDLDSSLLLLAVDLNFSGLGVLYRVNRCFTNQLHQMHLLMSIQRN
ncbi:Uncharacterised protein [Vibrio cholerae]|nr:Uncharacterised protein [Vibrio cholerae]CSI58432.1 Uncharacterised protein [Vibrio cholerae]